MKNTNMKINTNRKTISSQEIGNLQNFDAVLKGYSAATIPFYKKWWFATGSGVAVIGAIATALYVFNSPSLESTTQAPATTVEQIATPAQEAFIQPAFKGFDVDFEQFWVNSGTAQTLIVSSGSTINIPPCHFTDEAGNPIQGKVEIRYREMNDGVDFAVSGIPMTYDSAGQEFLFESAGMFEVQGWQNGKQVFINPTCPITIEQKTVSTDGKFNMYYLDTINRNWQYIGKPNWQANEELCLDVNDLFEPITVNEKNSASISFPSLHDHLDNELESLKKEIAELEKTAWVEPKLMDANKQNFTLNFDTLLFAEFKPFANTIFGVSDASKFSPALYQYDWNTATLTVNGLPENATDSINVDAVGKYGYTLFLSNGTHMNEAQRRNRMGSSNKIWHPWYVRLWHTVQGWFGKKATQQKSTRRRNDVSETDTSHTELPSTFALIPVDSTQYFYSGSGYRTPVSFTVYPVLDSANYKKAMADFDTKMNAHNALLQEKMDKEAELIKEIVRRDSAYAAEQVLFWKQKRKKELEENGIDMNYALATDSASQQNHSKIVNSFAASRFGIYNCDFPFRYSNPVTKTVTFKDAQNKNLYIGSAFIIVANKNALMNIMYNNCCNTSLNYVKQHKNIFFTVLPDDRIAYFTTEDFKNLPDDGVVDLPLRISNKKMENVAEVKTYLRLNSKSM